MHELKDKVMRKRDANGILSTYIFFFFLFLFFYNYILIYGAGVNEWTINVHYLPSVPLIPCFTRVFPASACCGRQAGACHFPIGSWGCWETFSNWRGLSGSTIRWALLVQPASHCPLLDPFYPIPKFFWDSIFLLDMGKLYFEALLIFWTGYGLSYLFLFLYL